jgi:threonine aldolase
VERIVDLRSDTLTKPTPEMYEAMRAAELGDDVVEEDPTVKRLEELAAERMGKEAGLFVASGTMGNLTAMVTHTKRGEEVICEAESHVFFYEAAGMSVVGSLLPRCLPGDRGALDPVAVERAIRPADIHQPRTGLICLENTHNRAGGTILRPEQVDAVAAVARRRGIPLHVDGARIFNAAVALGIDVAELVRGADSVTFCLSKGLSAPVGSVLTGNRDFIRRARQTRKMLGGGMRQAGVIAAAGIVALTSLVDRLAEDHENARALARGMAATPGVTVDLSSVQTNMVYCDVSGTGLPAAEFVKRMAAQGVKAYDTGPSSIRLVTYRGITAADVELAVARIRAVARQAT